MRVGGGSLEIAAGFHLTTTTSNSSVLLQTHWWRGTGEVRCPRTQQHDPGYEVLADSPQSLQVRIPGRNIFPAYSLCAEITTTYLATMKYSRPAFPLGQ